MAEKSGQQVQERAGAPACVMKLNLVGLTGRQSQLIRAVITAKLEVCLTGKGPPSSLPTSDLWETYQRLLHGQPAKNYHWGMRRCFQP
ncbi:MAG: hypothetical protein N3G20_06545 [Verrucomicrobiae bacterium]|nr:hypothetical protein [Verrucomicrobiae bacterium]